MAEVNEIKQTVDPVSEFEENWGKSTEAKAPDAPVRVAPPKPVDLIEEEYPEVKEERLSISDNPEAEYPRPTEKLSADLSAELTVTGIDFAQSLVFRLANSRKMVRRIGKENIARFAEILEQLVTNKTAVEELTDTDKILFRKYKRLQQVADDIPFTDDEYTKLQDIFSKYYKETGKGMPPWFGLSIALTETLGARLADALTE